jgi:hypothetical protein
MPVTAVGQRPAGIGRVAQDAAHAGHIPARLAPRVATPRSVSRRASRQTVACGSRYQSNSCATSAASPGSTRTADARRGRSGSRRYPNGGVVHGMSHSRISALGTRPVSPDYPGKHQLRGISPERIRRDRILQEALATGADPLHLALVFSIDHTNAMAYVNAARNLLSSPAGQALSPAPGRRVDSGRRSPRVSRPAT